MSKIDKIYLKESYEFENAVYTQTVYASENDQVLKILQIICSNLWDLLMI
jgi:hypothetical protein